VNTRARCSSIEDLLVTRAFRYDILLEKRGGSMQTAISGDTTLLDMAAPTAAN